MLSCLAAVRRVHVVGEKRSARVAVFAAAAMTVI